MLFSIFVALLSPFIWAGSQILDSHVSNNLFKKNSSVIFYLGLTNLFVLPLIVWWGGVEVLHFPTSVWPIIVLAAALEVGYQIPYFLALKRMDVSIIAAMFSFGRIFMPVLAYLIVGEELSLIQYIGFFVIIGATMVLNLKRTDRLRLDISFYLMLCASFMTVLGSVISKKALDDMNWLSCSFYYILVSDGFMLGMLLIPKLRREIVSDFHIFKQKFKLLMFMEVLDRSASLTSMLALSLLPVVVKSALGSTQPIFVLMYGYILYYFFGSRFKENLTRSELVKKLICFAVIIVGVVLTVW